MWLLQVNDFAWGGSNLTEGSCREMMVRPPSGMDLFHIFWIDISAKLFLPTNVKFFDSQIQKQEDDIEMIWKCIPFRGLTFPLIFTMVNDHQQLFFSKTIRFSRPLFRGLCTFTSKAGSSRDWWIQDRVVLSYIPFTKTHRKMHDSGQNDELIFCGLIYLFVFSI